MPGIASRGEAKHTAISRWIVSHRPDCRKQRCFAVEAVRGCARGTTRSAENPAAGMISICSKSGRRKMPFQAFRRKPVKIPGFMPAHDKRSGKEQRSARFQDPVQFLQSRIPVSNTCSNTSVQTARSALSDRTGRERMLPRTSASGCDRSMANTRADFHKSR